MYCDEIKVNFEYPKDQVCIMNYISMSTLSETRSNNKDIIDGRLQRYNVERIKEVEEIVKTEYENHNDSAKKYFVNSLTYLLKTDSLPNYTNEDFKQFCKQESFALRVIELEKIKTIKSF